jgi:hypothetical protein
MVQEFYCGQMRVSGFSSHYKFVLGAGAKVEERSDEIPPWRGKNRDKQLTFIVRVISRLFKIRQFNPYLIKQLYTHCLFAKS